MGDPELNLDSMQLQIEGGEVLKKNPATLDECGLKDNQTILVEIVEKPSASSGASKAKKAAKEEPKVQLTFTVRARVSGSSNEDVHMRDDHEEEKKTPA